MILSHTNDTQPYKMIPSLTKLYSAIQNYTQLYKMIPSHKEIKNGYPTNKNMYYLILTLHISYFELSQTNERLNTQP